MQATIFVLAFGPPRPLHRLVLSNWGACSEMTFVVLSDQPVMWLDLAHSNTAVIEITPHQLFSQAAAHLGIKDLIVSHGDMFFGKISGWTVCGLRPLLASMFPDKVLTPFWGWVDYDVLLNAQAMTAHFQAHSDDHLLFFTQQDMLWEQFKVFSSSIPLDAFFKRTLSEGRPGSPLEAQLVYRLRGLSSLRADQIQQSQVAVHWHHTDSDSRAMASHVDVLVDQVDWTLKNRRTGGSLLFFVADSEVKHLDSTGDVFCFVPAAILAAHGHSSAGDRRLS